jgi:S-adenosylmethionine hydrolase
VLAWPVTGKCIITLTTDFGLRDAYVACMKGVILGIKPDATLVDVSHQVAPQGIDEASYLLESIWPYFPSDTIHLAVVDPGVGTTRKAIAVTAPHGRFVGPDNGLFAAVLRRQGAIDPKSGRLVAATAVELANPRYRLPNPSSTFHGRDIFAPAAAHLAAGVPLSELGPSLSDLLLSPASEPHIADGVIHGRVRHIDRFGNAITDISGDALSGAPRIQAGNAVIEGLSRDFQEREISALVGSTGYLELAVRNGNAAETLHLGPGDEVIVRSVQ